MDYQAIYQQFIKDRKAKQSELLLSGCYVERHHILPRSLGGDDSKENLISLGAEDHYFAHLLLAKIHGGKMWCAVLAMANLDFGTDRKGAFRARTKFGHVRRQVAKYFRENFSGLNSPSADQATHELRSMAGEVVVGTRCHLMAETGLSNRAISALLLGQKKSYGGWFSPTHNPLGKTRGELLSEAFRSPELLSLYHFDGREFVGSRVEFARQNGARYWLQPGSLHCLGWYAEKSLASSHHERVSSVRRATASLRGDISGESNPNADHSVYEFVNEFTGETVAKTRTQMQADYGISVSAIAGVVRGTQVSASGWKLKGVERKRAVKGCAYTFIHEDGSLFNGSRAEFEKHVGKSKGFALALIRGAKREGWSHGDAAHQVRADSGSP